MSEFDVKDFDKLSEHYNCEIPTNVQSFLSSFSGSFCDGSIDSIKNKNLELKYKTNDGFETGDVIESVFTTKEIIDQLQYIGYLDELKSHFELNDEYVQTEFLFPIVDLMDGAIYIAISGKNKDALYLADNGDFGITRLEMSLNELAQKLS